MVAEQVAKQSLRFRPLHSQGRHVRFVDCHVKPASKCKSLGKKKQIGIRDRQPESVICQFQQNRVIDQATCFIRDRDIKTIAGLGSGDIARVINWISLAASRPAICT